MIEKWIDELADLKMGDAASDALRLSRRCWRGSRRILASTIVRRFFASF
jgi:hypothetical protein